MNIILKIARSSKNNKVYACFELDYTKVFLNVDDAVKLTGLAYTELNYITSEQPLRYEVDLQEISE